jgi:hypothetical protein
MIGLSRRSQNPDELSGCEGGKMVPIQIETERSSSDGGLYLQKDADFNGPTIPTPWKTAPVEHFTADHEIDDQYKKITDVQINLDSTDLEAYRSNEDSQSLTRLQEKLKYSREFDLVIVFVDFAGAQAIEPKDMRTILDIQSEYGNVLTTPIQSSLTETLSVYMNNGELDLDHSPYDAIYTTIRHYLENLDEYDYPAMGFLPLIGWQRRREILREYESAGLELIGLDYRGLKPTKSDVFQLHSDLIRDMAVRDQLGSSLLYAFNYKSYHPKRKGHPIPSEAIALSTFGVDILGGCHVNRGAGGSGEITDVKIFNTSNFLFERVELDAIQDQFPGDSTIDPSELADFQYGKRTNLRKLINSEMLSVGTRKLRAAIRDGNERTFMEKKSGYLGDIQEQAVEIAARYDDAKGPDIVP